MEEDEIQNEMWLWEGGELRRTIGRIYSRVWGGEGFPEKWREGVIVSIAKKRGVKRVDEHRETTLMQQHTKYML